MANYLTFDKVMEEMNVDDSDWGDSDDDLIQDELDGRLDNQSRQHLEEKAVRHVSRHQLSVYRVDIFLGKVRRRFSVAFARKERGRYMAARTVALSLQCHFVPLPASVFFTQNKKFLENNSHHLER